MPSDRKRAPRLQTVELPPAVLAQLVRQKGRPAVDPVYHKQPVSIRLDREVIEFFKSEGPGWQTRLNEFLLGHMQRARVESLDVLGRAMETQKALATQKMMEEPS